MTIATTNPVVENALKACNWGSLKIGTRVEVDGRKGTITANPGGLTRYTVKFDDGKVEDKNSLAPYFKVINAATSAEPVAKNGRFGVDPEAKRSLEALKLSRQLMSRARDYIGMSEDDDEAPGQARDMDKIIKEMDSLIGWLKDYA